MARAMKDSGIEWVGEVPQNWRVLRNKDFLRNKSVKNYPNEEVLSLYREYGVIPKNSRNDNHNVTSEDTSSYKLVEKNDLVINKMKAWQGSMGISEYRGIISPAYYICSIISEELVPKFIHYAVRNNAYLTEYRRLSSGMRVGQWDLNIKDFLNIKTSLPPKFEQQKIATFLDEKTAHIDSIVAKTKESIEAFKAYKQALITETVTKGLNPDVKMKDSGIEWIGEIPEHWNLKKVKMIASKIGSGKTPRGGASVYSDSGILFLRSQNVYDTGLYLEEATYISEEIDEAMRSTRVYPNDVLLNITGGSIGRSCVYPANSKQHANVNQHVCIIRPIMNKITPQFLFYFLNSNAGQSAINYYQTGGNREGLNFEQIGNIRIPYYSISEQQQIADFLDEKTAHIDSLIANKEKMVQELETYKKAMIYEYVTGKKEVE